MQEMLRGDISGLAGVSSRGQDITKESYSVEDVLTGLSVLQEQLILSGHSECVALNSNIKPVLSAMLEKMTSTKNALDFDKKCSDIIDIVSMMFDFILDDLDLPIQLRSVIIRLQIPMIKVALLDDTFFNSRLQAARQLLNEFAYSANILHLVGQDSEQANNRVLVRVQKIVDLILKTFRINLDVFSTELRNFQQFIRFELKGQKAKTKNLQITKDIVVSELKQRLLIQQVPVVVEVFIKQTWNEVLTKVGLATNCDGKIWLSILQVTDDLIWSMQPKLMEQERKLLTKMIPMLLNRLQDGLCLIDYSKPLMQKFFNHMEKIHIQSLRGSHQMINPSDTRKNLNVGYHYKSPTLDSGLAVMSMNTSILLNPAEHMVVNTQSQAHSVVYDIGLPDSIKSEKTTLDSVAEMPIGTWVSFSMNHCNLIGKLDWKCDFTEEFRFVDRNCTLVQSINLANLLHLFESAKAKIIDDIPLFERAIDAVYHDLRVA